MLVAYIIFELRSDQTRRGSPSQLIPPYIPAYPGFADAVDLLCYQRRLLSCAELF